MEKYYTTREIADLLEVKQYRVREWIHLGLLKATRGPSRKFLIREECLFIYTYNKPRFRDLLSKKIGMRFNLYMHMLPGYMAVLDMVRKNPKLLERIKERKIKKEES